MNKLQIWLSMTVLAITTLSCTDMHEAPIKPENEQPAGFWSLSGNTVSHDPSLIKEANGLWWTFMTGTGIGVKYSSDGKNWTQGGQVFGNELSWWRDYAPNMGANDVWAPDCYYYRGRYWLYYAVSEFGTNNSAIGLTSCTSIVAGDWRDDGRVVSTSSGSNSTNAIDPNVFQDASGKPWLVYGSWFDGIKVVRLKDSDMKPSGTTHTIARASGGIENPDIVYNNGYYYLFVSKGVCCNGTNSTYNIAYGRSTSLAGPYYDKNGVNMLNGGGTVLDAGNSVWVGPGASDVYRRSGNYMMIRHAYDATDNGTPKMLINDLYFSNGWPTY
ncbi:MAG: glycoside hydrolase family 43 protein [Reichenbachiella sp.]